MGQCRMNNHDKYTIASSTSDLNKRLNWIDWMKSIGIFLIILSHHFPAHLCPYLFAFVAQVFFLISGFLSKKEKSISVFFSKNLRTLIIPYLLINLISWLYPYIWNHRNVGTDHFLTDIFIYPWAGILLGIQNWKYNVCGPLWFVYSLFLIKLLFQLVPTKKRTIIIICIFSTVVPVVMSHFQFHPPLAALNTFLAMPFFLLGYNLSNRYKYQFECLSRKLLCINKFMLVVIIMLLNMCIFVIGHYNYCPWMHLNSYGNNIILFYLGGICGSFMIYLVSLSLNDFRLSIITVISSGTILILGFHIFLIPIMQYLFENVLALHGFVSSFLSSITILVLFIPFIKFCQTYFPIIIGKKKLARIPLYNKQ